MADMSTLVFYVNGKKIVERQPDPETALLPYLRNNLGLRGTKAGCEQGGCGSCTVMISHYDVRKKKIRHYSAVACLVPLVSLHHKSVTTVEGVGSTITKLHPVQERLAKCHGVQCGFCSPGMVMSLYTLLRNNPEPCMKDIQTAMEGNLCRCTGYRAILEAGSTFTNDGCCGKENCCRSGGSRPEDMVLSPTYVADFTPYDPTQEPIFPSELQLTEPDSACLKFQGKRVTFYRPSTIDQALAIAFKNTDVKFIAGGTIIGTGVRSGRYPVVVSLENVAELSQVEVLENGIGVGAGLTLNQLQEELGDLINREDESKTRIVKGIAKGIGRIAAMQVRNMGTIGGNLGTGKSIYDLATWLMAGKCSLQIFNKGGKCEVPMDHNYHDEVMKRLEAGDIIGSVFIPFNPKDTHYYSYKHCKRLAFDWSEVSAGAMVEFEPGTTKIRDMVLTFGNVLPTTAVAVETCKKVRGRTWDESLASDVCEYLSDEFKESSNGTGLTAYKRTIMLSLFYKFYMGVSAELRNIQGSSHEEAQFTLTDGPIKSTRVFEQVPEGQSIDDAVGRTIVHESGFECTAGQAKFTDDMPSNEGELHVGVVQSTKAHARIISVDPSAALDLEGVVCFIDHEDVIGSNDISIPMNEEEIFASKMVKTEGTVIGAVIAETQKLAREAAKLVKVTYEDLKPICSLEEAIANCDQEPDVVLKSGDLEEGFKASDHVVEGEFTVGGQEHFYMEPNAAVAVPGGEHMDIELTGGSQELNLVQAVVAQALDIQQNRVNVKMRRIGGSFGGKYNSGLPMTFLPCAIAANKLQRPVRSVVDREEDMIGTGKRHRVLFKYNVGFDKDGRIQAFKMDVYIDAGCTKTTTISVLQLLMLFLENNYRVPNMVARGFICLTNLQSNCAFRGFGGPQAVLATEHIIMQIANTLDVSQERIRYLNLLVAGDVTTFGFKLEESNGRRCWNECVTQSDFEARKHVVGLFNKQNTLRKRGISMTPIKYPLRAIMPSFFMQAGALVQIYLDGSVLITHGGAEMGQGLTTRIVQVASRALGAPISKIHTKDASTDKCANQTVTAGSIATEKWGGAVLKACLELKERLKPFHDAKPNGTWETWIKDAHLACVCLSVFGHYTAPGSTFDWKTWKGKVCDYCTYGAACSEVEVDCLTGAHRVIRTDIVMDAGKSLNPAIDIGQIEGAFLQGVGYYMLEENLHNPDGTLKTRDANTYKIPTVGDIPMEFNVSLLKGTANDKPHALYSSKGTGEPPLLLATSVFCAAKDAIAAARIENGLSRDFRLDGPATAEKIRMLCGDKFVKMATTSK